MTITSESLVDALGDAERAASLLQNFSVVDHSKAHTNLLSMAKAGIPVDLLVEVCRQLAKYLPGTSDPDMALNNFERFFSAARSRVALAALFDRDETAIPTLLTIFSSSQFLSDLLIRDRESYDALRLTEGQPIARDILVGDLTDEILKTDSEQDAMLKIRRFKHREILRIAYGDIIGEQQIQVVTGQLSYLADAILSAAFAFEHRRLTRKFGLPRDARGNESRMFILALGKLGGNELNYSSDIDLIAFYQSDGETGGERSVSNEEFFTRLTRGTTRLLTEPTELGSCYRVDLRLRPEGSRGPVCTSIAKGLQYYDVHGRTWERQAYVKARPVSGDELLGRDFLDRLQPWVYQRRLSRADISGIKALKRRIERRAFVDGEDELNIKTGRGGIRDIEFTIQFLQLINGGESRKVHATNTLKAIGRLQRIGCLTMQEQTLLEQNYCWLRKLEHRLQIMFDLQTHTLPESPAEQEKIALRMGYDSEKQSPLKSFRRDLDEITRINRNILDHLLHSSFGDISCPDGSSDPAAGSDGEQVPIVIDLLLHPEPSREFIEKVLRGYGFVNLQTAYSNLLNLSVENIRFLSTRRCRHFFAAIAPRLLEEISRTPDPDQAMRNLSSVSDSLGGKAALWELFNVHPPSLDLYVRICAACPYLSDILRRNPGMLDELLDSLVLDELPDRYVLNQTLAELVSGAEDIDPILHSFRNAQHLLVGVRDVLGRDKLRDTQRALSDIAESCLRTIADHQIMQLIGRYGQPIFEAGGERRPCAFVILALGKLGGREPNYHSDLDVIFLYEANGETDRPGSATSNQHFFSKLAASISKRMSSLGPFGKLYEIDSRLRPTGKSGALAVSFAEFQRYFTSGSGQLWERLALCKSRPIYGPEVASQAAMGLVHEAITSVDFTPHCTDEIRQMRFKMEHNCSPHNLKRGTGGTADIEFVLQMLQMRSARRDINILVPNTHAAASQLFQQGQLSRDDFEFFEQAYEFLRNIESKLRLMNTTQRHEFPQQESTAECLAYLLGFESWRTLLKETNQIRSEVRRRFERIFSTE